MAVTKYTCPPQPASGQGTFSDNLVGFQLVDGGGFTQANFEFTTGITEKQNRNFSIGAFSEPISLENLDIDSVIQSNIILANNYQVYPNYDLSQVTNFTLYGSLTKRLSVSIEKIINYFPAALEILGTSQTFVTGKTANGIIYDSVQDETYLEVNLDLVRNPFDVDYTDNADVNFQLSEIDRSPLRNLKTQYKKYILTVDDKQYPILFLTPTNSSSTTLNLYVKGKPFDQDGYSVKNLVIRPNDLEVNTVFSHNFDQVENFILNRLITPEYTAIFQVPQEADDGTYYVNNQSITFPKDTGLWNLDIVGPRFNDYLNKLNAIAENLDSYKTNLISRFLTTGALKEFDTPDQKIEKVLQIYGRSFDETKKFIDALANINSVNYNVGNDIPSQLLKNLAQTLGWSTNISPISNDALLDSVFTNGTNEFTGRSRGLTPEELNYQYYRNLILNSAYLFKSKGTRKTIEFLLRLIGAPDAIVEFNEYIYVADQKINLNEFDDQYAQISGGTYNQQLPVLDNTDIFSIMGNQYTGYTTTTITEDVNATLRDYPIDSFGYPSMPADNDDYFFQVGGGWFESTPQHRMPEQVDLTNSVFTGSNPNYQTVLKPFNYGQEYLDRYRNLPFMNLGFTLKKEIDNKKSWSNDTNLLRKSFDARFNSYYEVYDEKLVINVKNVDIFMNPSQGLVYDVWSMSRRYNYPIPEQGMNYVDPSYCNGGIMYPDRGGIDWTNIVPKPKQKTFFEFAQTFWHNMINVRNRQFITDGKTGGYPTLQSIYWKYLESEQFINIPNDNFTYQTMIDYVNGLGSYWTKLIEQMIPATTIWNTGTKYENSIFHRQKYVWRRQRGCQIVPIPCEPCSLIGQLFPYDCPIQAVTCPIYPYKTKFRVRTFGDILGNLLNNYLKTNNLTIDDCDFNSMTSTWYVDVRLNGTPIVSYPFFNGVGYNNPILSSPTDTDWLNAITSSFVDLQTYGLNYFINDNNTITVYNNNCTPIGAVQTFTLNVGINFNILCN